MATVPTAQEAEFNAAQDAAFNAAAAAAAPTVETVPTVETAAAAVVINPNSTAAMFAAAATATMEQFVQETGQYLNLEDGCTYKMLFKGMGEIASTLIDNMGEAVAVAALQDEQGLAYVNGDSIMVSTCQKIQAAGHAPCIIVIYVRGDVKSKSGRKYKDLQIFRLPN